MERDRGTNVVKCIKTTKSPWVEGGVMKYRWVVRRFTKDGGHVDVMKYREWSPSDKLVRRNIFKGLKAHDNYPLPRYADSVDLLNALCEEAGWHVEDDGSIHQK